MRCGKRCAQEVCARGLRMGRVCLPTSLTRTFHVEHPSVAFALGMNPPALTRARVSIRCSSKAADRDPKRPSTKLDTGDLPAGRPHDVPRYEDRCPSIGRASSQSWRKARQVPMALGWRTAPAPFIGLASSQAFHSRVEGSDTANQTSPSRVARPTKGSVVASLDCRD